jgi:peptidoglycan/xylan/chitin deacetylase (PgdA/CDA1 family)
MPYTKFISLDQAVERIRSREIDRHYTVVTFDDGYQSNHQYAYPILIKYRVSATIFLNVGAIEAGQLYWEIINAVLLNENNSRVVFSNGKKSEMVFDLKDPAARLRAIYDSHYFLKSWRKEEIEGLISRLRRNYSVDELHFDPVLSWDDAAKMNSDLISFGSHGLSHVILTKMNRSEWVDEIMGSKQIIENRLGTKIASFAYPNGEAQDFNDSIVALVKQAGYTSAATAIQGAVGAEGADLFRLPRVDVTERISLGANGQFSQALFLCKVFRIL